MNESGNIYPQKATFARRFARNGGVEMGLLDFLGKSQVLQAKTDVNH